MKTPGNFLGVCVFGPGMAKQKVLHRNKSSKPVWVEILYSLATLSEERMGSGKLLHLTSSGFEGTGIPKFGTPKSFIVGSYAVNVYPIDTIKNHFERAWFLASERKFNKLWVVLHIGDRLYKDTFSILAENTEDPPERLMGCDDAYQFISRTIEVHQIHES